MPPCRLIESLNLIRFAPLTPFTTFQQFSASQMQFNSSMSAKPWRVSRFLSCIRPQAAAGTSLLCDCTSNAKSVQLWAISCPRGRGVWLPFLPSFSLIQRGWVGHGTSFPQALLDVSSAVSAAAPGASWSRPHHSQRASGDQANSGIPLPLASCHPAALYRAYRCV